VNNGLVSNGDGDDGRSNSAMPRLESVDGVQ
jgi:hypothetical protein